MGPWGESRKRPAQRGRGCRKLSAAADGNSLPEPGAWTAGGRPTRKCPLVCGVTVRRRLRSGADFSTGWRATRKNDTNMSRFSVARQQKMSDSKLSAFFSEFFLRDLGLRDQGYKERENVPLGGTRDNISACLDKRCFLLYP